MKTNHLMWIGVVSLFLLGTSNAQELAPAIPVPAESQSYSPYLDRDFPDEALFGDTHLHTAVSADAGLAFATLSPDDAYRFARGQEVTSSLGIPARLKRPLDWLVVTDHAENLGLPVAISSGDSVMQANSWARSIVDAAKPGTFESAVEAYTIWFGTVNAPGAVDPMAETDLAKSYWLKTTEAAERHNSPGAFTAFIGFEWTSTPNGNNLHRNVIFRDGKDLADQIIPLSAYDTEDPEELWAWMSAYEEKTGGRLLALAHNGNLSNGLMFDDVTFAGDALSEEYARLRQRWEPIYEVTQIKGDGETHPLLSAQDEFADFETWDKGSFGTELKTPDMLPREYAREALKRGLAYEDRLGTNPFKFGLVGSTDSHTGLSTASENNFFGKVSALEPTNDPIRFEEAITGAMTPDDPSDDIVAALSSASGLAVVWAEENTREAIWNAMKRREVYATSGTRIRVRVFAGYGFDQGDVARSDFAAHGYTNGVPMGGELTNANDGQAPGLLIRALRDPEGANLDRIQVVKGWLDQNGDTLERVYDVAWSGDRRLDRNGSLPPVGNTVDTELATWRNDIGAPLLATFWQDPDFDRSQRAFYYVRVIEIPTPRWTTIDARVFGVDIPDGVPLSIQERAYTSPVWYTP